MPSRLHRLRALIGRESWPIYLRTYALGAIAALFETASIAAVFPVVAAIVGTQHNQANGWFAQGSVGGAFGLLGGLYAAGLALRAFAIQQTANVNLAQGYAFGARLFKQALDQPYDWQFSHHSSDTRAAILSDAQDLITYVTFPLGRLISQMTLVTTVAVVLLAVQPIATVAFGGTILIVYTMIFVGLRKPLKRDAERQIKAHANRHRLSTEAFAAGRELRLSHLEGRFVQEFNTASVQLAEVGTNKSVFSELPKLALEALIFTVLAWMLYFTLSRPDLIGPSQLPALAVFAAAGLKVFPMGHQVFANLATLRGGWPLVAKFEKLFQGFDTPDAQAPCPILQNEIAFKNVSFAYPDSADPAVKNINFVAHTGQKVAIIGPSGTGKSTLIDLIAGLIQPSDGVVLIDGMRRLPNQCRSWQTQLRYCPQNPCLFDVSVGENITLSAPCTPEKLRAAVYLACLDDLFSGGKVSLSTRAGEQGRNLSGGQIKRISIARAMLDDVAVYILDEPTSTLDTATADAMISRIFAAKPRAIIFVVTHDQRLADSCDLVVDLTLHSDNRPD